MGIASALKASSSELNFIVACDIPNIKLRYVRKMLTEADESKADIVIPTSNDGQNEPLFAIYRKSAIDAINKVLSSGGRKIADIFSLCNVRYIEFDDADWLINLNTMVEYEKYQAKHRN
jgi:molybdopterin-guanine dinucleotide biosynthesis protein A